MNYYIFKNPRKKGDKELEKFHYEPTEFIIQQKALKFGPIVVLSEAEVKEADKI